MASPVIPLNTNTFSKATDAAIRKYFVDEYKLAEPKLELIYMVQNQENKSDEYTGMTGLSGQFSEIAENEKYPEDTSIATYDTTFVVSKRGTTESITWEANKWSRTRDLVDSGKKLAKAAKMDIGHQMAGVLTGGWATPASTVMAYGDGKDLFTIGALRADGGTAFSNTSATSIVLNEANLWVGMIALSNQVDDRGEIADFSATKLIVPAATSNEKTARVILGSEKKAETGDNDMNLYKGMLDLVTVKYLNGTATGTAAHSGCWYLVDSNNNPLVWQWGQKPTVERDDSVGFLNDTVVYKIRYERSRGFRNHRGIWASYGDGTTTIAD